MVRPAPQISRKTGIVPSMLKIKKKPFMLLITSGSLARGRRGLIELVSFV